MTTSIDNCKLFDMVLNVTDAVWGPPHTWPKLIRRVYVCLFPLAWLVRMTTFVALVVVTLPIAWSCYLFRSLSNIWNGESGK